MSAGNFDPVQARNDLHFFAFLGVVIGGIVGVAVGCTIGTAALLGALKDWQPAIASIVALIVGMIALHNVNRTINATSEQNEVNRRIDREKREQDRLLEEKPFRDCGILFGESCKHALKICEDALNESGNTRLGVGLLGAGFPPPAPRQFTKFAEYNAVWEDEHKPLLEVSSAALNPAARAQAQVLQKLIDKIMAITANHTENKASPYPTIQQMRGLDQRQRGQQLVRACMTLADRFASGSLF